MPLAALTHVVHASLDQVLLPALQSSGLTCFVLEEQAFDPQSLSAELTSQRGRWTSNLQLQGSIVPPWRTFHMSTDDSMNLPGDATGNSPSQIQDRAKQDLSSATETAKRDLGSAAETAKRELDSVAQQAADQVANLKSQASAQIHDATDKAKTFASEQKNFAAGQITGVASAIDRVADELEGGDQQMVARYARDLASGLSRFGNNVQNKDVDDLIGMAQNFGRSQPLAFLGAAALAGFVASRFAMASAQRRQNTQTSGQYSGGQSYSGNSTPYGSGASAGYGAGTSTGSGYGSSASTGYGSGSSTSGYGSGSSTSTGYGSGSSGGSGYGAGSSNTSGTGSSYSSGTSGSSGSTGYGSGSSTSSPSGTGASTPSTYGNSNQSGDE
jgi:ElaB/YqjD/DUF883 family membrane-anchored ribosome-binding protein